MRKSDTYRGARRNMARKLVHPARGYKGFIWGDGFAVAANTKAKLAERRATCNGAREAVAKVLVEQDVLYHGVRHDIVALRALREHWATQVPCSRRMRSRMLKQLDLDLRSARA